MLLFYFRNKIKFKKVGEEERGGGRVGGGRGEGGEEDGKIKYILLKCFFGVVGDFFRSYVFDIFYWIEIEFFFRFVCFIYVFFERDFRGCNIVKLFFGD